MELDEKQKALVLSLARNNMNISQTAKEMFYTWRGIMYQIEKMERKLNLSPRNFYDLCKLVSLASSVTQDGTS
jgi:sugar diacid utilization regulator